jgi:hypothetical protein
MTVCEMVRDFILLQRKIGRSAYDLPECQPKKNSKADKVQHTVANAATNAPRKPNATAAGLQPPPASTNQAPAAKTAVANVPAAAPASSASRITSRSLA